MNDLIATDIDTGGAISYWTLSETPVTALEEAWLYAGLDPDLLPPTPSPTEALRIAMRSETRYQLLARSVSSTRWVLKRENVDAAGTDLDWETVAAAEVHSDSGELVVHAAEPLASSVRAAYEHALTHHTATKLSGFVVRQCRAHAAVGLRDTGGIYYVPPGYVDDWRDFAAALSDANSRSHVFLIPAMRGDDAVRAVTSALEADITGHVTKMRDEAAKGLAVATLTRRLRACETLRAKVAAYRGLLGSATDAVDASVRGLAQHLAALKLAAAAKAKG